MCFGKSDIYNHLITPSAPAEPAPAAPVKTQAQVEAEAAAKKVDDAARVVMERVQANKLAADNALNGSVVGPCPHV